MNLLIVESENDEFFVQALLEYIHQTTTDVCSIDVFKHSSLSMEKLITQLESAFTEVIKQGNSKIGVILDLDADTTKNRLKLVNECLNAALKSTFGKELQNPINNTNEFIHFDIDEYINIKIACHFTNLNGEGELETVLKAIKSKDSIFADCLIDGWKHCFIAKGKIIAPKGGQGDITDKEILKLWVDFYKRFDTLPKSKRNSDFTDWKGIWTGKTQPNKRQEVKEVNARGKEIFHLDSTLLDEMKMFLKLFN